MKFLVTGSAGFIGYRFCRDVLTSGHAVTGIDNYEPEYPVELKIKRTSDLETYRNFQFIKLGVENEAIKSVLKDRRYDYVVHMAAKDKIYEDTTNLNYSEYLRANVLGTAKVMEVAKLTGAKKFIFTSTHSVYGNTKKATLTEKKIVPNPASPHGASKIAAEQVVKFISNRWNIPSVILRVFSVYGPDMRPHTLIPLAIKRIKDNQPLDLYQTNRASRDYIYIDDVVEYIKACLNKRIKFQIINIGTSKSYTTEEVAGEIAKAIGKDPSKISYTQHEKDFDSMVARNVRADITRAIKILKYSPKIDLTEGIKRTVNWYVSNPKNLEISVHA